MKYYTVKEKKEALEVMANQLSFYEPACSCDEKCPGKHNDSHCKCKQQKLGC